MHLKQGFILNNGKYEILDLLGQGGFGITYKAAGKAALQGPFGSLETTMVVAIKEFFFKDFCQRDSKTMRLTFSSATGKELFQRFKEKLVKEALILSQLHHPNIIRVIEIFEENNTAYMVMEFVDGNSLLELLDETCSLPTGRAARYVYQIGEALGYVHSCNILHLDVKPSNILIRKKDDRALLIDFGVSKRYSLEHKATSFTTVGRSKGYAPPEQYTDNGTAVFDPSLDVYSLGATLYHCITGIIPPEPYEILVKGFALPSAFTGALPGNLEQAILKAMALKRTERFQSVEEFIQTISHTEKSNQEPDPIKPSADPLPEPGDGGETPPGGAWNGDRMPEPPLPANIKEKKPKVEIYGGVTEPEVERPAAPGKGDELQEPPAKRKKSNKAEIKPEKLPPQPPSSTPAEPEKPFKKNHRGLYWLRWIIAGFIIVGSATTIYWWYNRGPSAKELEEKRIADSTRVADSLYASTLQIEMVYVPGGTFQMGNNDGYIDEKPVHQVTVNSFYIGKYEVTQDQWKAVMDHNPSYFSGCGNCPVEEVSWNDVQDFIRKLNEKSGKRYRLPTEAEWEFAARGGNKSKGNKFAGTNDGSQLYRFANFYDANCENGKKTNSQNDGYKNTAPVGSYLPNELGIYDMSGNVWEWCADWYDANYYSNSPENNPKNTTTNKGRVCRGGSCGTLPSACRIAYRSRNAPVYRNYILGFRLLRME